jgi:hypothetical protein
LAIASAAIISGAVILFMTPEGKSTIAKYQSWWIAPKTEIRPLPAIPLSFALLNVIDDTRRFFSVDEQKALFAGLSDISRDPLSMQVRKLTRTADSKYGLCGEVNLKNGLGGYVGFTPFYGVLTGATAMIGLVPQIVAEKVPEDSKMLLVKFGCQY